MHKVKRYFLEILPRFHQTQKLDFKNNNHVYCEFNKNAALNRFWSEKKWTEYLSNNFLKTYILKVKKSLAGFYELEYHKNKNEVELIQLGLLREYRGQKLGSLLLQHVLYESKKLKCNRVWVHTCSLDHRHALKNYIARGFKIFKQEHVYISN
jgi:GNAT superfamily N-acetyltransferase